MSNKSLENLECLAISLFKISIKMRETGKEFKLPEIHSMVLKDLTDGTYYAMALDYSLMIESDNANIEDALNNLFLSLIDMFELKRDLRMRKDRDLKKMLAMAPTDYWDKFRDFREEIENDIINNIFAEIESQEISFDKKIDFLKKNNKNINENVSDSSMEVTKAVSTTKIKKIAIKKIA